MEKKKVSTAVQFMPYGLILFNAVLATYINHNESKVGAYHIWLCSAFGILLVIYSIFSVFFLVRDLKRKTGGLWLDIAFLILTALVLVSGIYSTVPYFKDIFAGSRTVTTDTYIVVRDNLYFLDNEENEVRVKLPEDLVAKYRSRENSEYDSKINVLKHKEKITVEYFPNSGVLIDP